MPLYLLIAKETESKLTMSDDLDRILALEESALNKNKEIERILQCCQFDYFNILEINPLSVANIDELPLMIKKLYRKKSLLIHPDKTDNPNASDAFDRLKKAERILSANESDDELWKEKNRLLAIYQASYNKQNLDKSLSFNDIQNQTIRTKVEEILQDEINHEELQRLVHQTTETRKHELQERIKRERELKKKMENQWEDERDNRVKNWRGYVNKVEKKNNNKNKKKKDSTTKKKSKLNIGLNQPPNHPIPLVPVSEHTLFGSKLKMGMKEKKFFSFSLDLQNSIPGQIRSNTPH